MEKLEELIENKERLGNRVSKHGGAVNGGVKESEPLVGKDEVEGILGLNGRKEVSQVGMDAVLRLLRATRGRVFAERVEVHSSAMGMRLVGILVCVIGSLGIGVACGGTCAKLLYFGLVELLN